MPISKHKCDESILINEIEEPIEQDFSFQHQIEYLIMQHYLIFYVMHFKGYFLLMLNGFIVGEVKEIAYMFLFFSFFGSK
jgi:hypothetical protein